MPHHDLARVSAVERQTAREHHLVQDGQTVLIAMAAVFAVECFGGRKLWAHLDEPRWMLGFEQSISLLGHVA